MRLRFDNDHYKLARAVERIRSWIDLSVGCEREAVLTDLECDARDLLYFNPDNTSLIKRVLLGVRRRLLWPQYDYNMKAVRALRVLREQGHAGSLRSTVIILAPFDVSRDNTGGAVRLRQMALALSSYFRVRVVSLVGSQRKLDVMPLGGACDLICVPQSKAFSRCVIGRRDRYGAAAQLMALLECWHSLEELAFVIERERISASVLVVDSPYYAPLLRSLQEQEQMTIVYEAQNFEKEFLPVLLASSVGNQEEAVSVVMQEERWLSEHADLIITVSNEDGRAFEETYDVPRDRIVLCPNGIDVSMAQYYPSSLMRRLKERASIDMPCVLFTGSEHVPNLKAVCYIVKELAPAIPGALFIITGLSLRTLQKSFSSLVTVGENVVFTGFVPEAAKEAVMALCDIAICPVDTGGGSSLKIPDYLAHGKPVVTTEFGMRGYRKDLPGIVVCSKKDMVQEVGKLLAKPPCDTIRCGLRTYTERSCDWSVCFAGLTERLIGSMDIRQ